MDPTAVLSSVSGLVSLARGLTALKTDIEVEQVRSAFLGQITEVQQTTLQLQEDLRRARERISELERELGEMRDWSKEKECYTLRSLGIGAHVYVQKPGPDGVQPLGEFCVHCFDNGKRELLQFAGHQDIHRILECPNCKSRVLFQYSASRI